MARRAKLQFAAHKKNRRGVQAGSETQGFAARRDEEIIVKAPAIESILRLKDLWAFPARARARVRTFRESSELAPSLLFFRQWVRHPLDVGAAWPSSRRLADRMVAHVPAQGDGLVLELGAGTGVVTRALLARGVAPSRLRVVERSPLFARCLRRRFPELAVIEGDAALLANYLPTGARVDAIVSSLPLRAMPADVVGPILAQWQGLVRPGGVVVQFTYAPLGKTEDGDGRFLRCADSWVLRNLPPARVETMVRLAQPGAADRA